MNINDAPPWETGAEVVEASTERQAQRETPTRPEEWAELPTLPGMPEVDSDTKDSLSEMVGRLRLASHALAECKKAEARAREMVLAAMQEHGLDSFRCDAGLATVSERRGSQTIDSKRFRQDHPELAARYTKVGKSATVLVFTRPKEGE